MDAKYRALNEYFGYKTFRPLQEEAVDAILSGRDVLMILPTGGGKSLSYQLPTLLMEGVTVVISPLLALMHDQVESLKAQGMQAAMLSSMQSSEESAEIVRGIFSGQIRFLYLSPERLNTESMLRMLKQLKINYFVIDEAHCISEWGHEFRADFRQLAGLREHFPQTPIAAFTATATDHVRTDIARSLRLNNPLILRGKIFRKNLQITVRNRMGDGYTQLTDFLGERKSESGIVYAFSRKSVEAVAHYLQSKGFSAAAYHAGMETGERNRIYRAFVHDEIKVIVATIAFGMGIDKSNIRYVAHMSLPKTIENYYQEIGRAGRDGDHADVVLLYGAADIIQQKRFVDEIDDAVYRDHLMEKLSAMHRYAASESCRHRQLAEYFGDSLEPCATACDNCLEPDYEKRDISEAARMLLSAVYRTGQRFGKGYIIDVLRGSKEQKVLANEHDKLSVYGIGEKLDKRQWQSIIDRLLELGALDVNEHKGLVLGAGSTAILKSQESVSIRSERLDVKAKTVKKHAPESFDYDRELFDRLRSLRQEIAKEEGVPAYMVFSDKTLKEMAAVHPTDRAAMLEIGGVGEKKFERFGNLFLEALNS